MTDSGHTHAAQTDSDAERAAVGALVKTSLVDYPGRVACTLFLCGCNLRCPYCYNPGLVGNSLPENDAVTAEDVFSHLEKRKKVLSGFVISGGEPFLSSCLGLFIDRAKRLGYKVKTDTNGMLPERLEQFLGDGTLCPDFVALDIKTSPGRYDKMGGIAAVRPEIQAEALRRSVSLTAQLPSGNREYRTVLVPGLVTKRDIADIASMLPRDASWMFAPFKPGNCLDGSYNTLSPYTSAEMEELVSYARSFIPGAALR